MPRIHVCAECGQRIDNPLHRFFGCNPVHHFDTCSNDECDHVSHNERKIQKEGGEKMDYKEKLIAAVKSFQALARIQLDMVQVEKEGDEDTVRFGLADETGEVRAILLTDNAKYSAVDLGTNSDEE